MAKKSGKKTAKQLKKTGAAVKTSGRHILSVHIDLPTLAKLDKAASKLAKKTGGRDSRSAFIIHALKRAL